MRDRRRLALALLFALTLALAFPFRAGELRFDFGLVAGWLALAPLAALIRDLSPRAAFTWTLFASWFGYTLVIFWLYVVVTVHGGAPVLGGIGAVAVVTGVFAVHAGAAAALSAWLSERVGRAGVLVLPSAWLVMEHLRGFDFLGGFTWACLGYAAHVDLPLLGLASWVGVYGLSFLMALCGTLLGVGRWPSALAVVAASHLLGLVALPRDADLVPAAEPPLRVTLVQGNIPQGEKWDPARAQRNLDVHLELSRAAAANDRPDLILWPESSVPGFVDVQAEYRDPLVAIARETGVPFVVGAIGLTRLPEPRRMLFHNSLFVVTPADGIVDRYDKAVLVPFGEYVPLRSLLGFLSAIAKSLEDVADISPGRESRPLRGLESLGPNALPVGLICYEAVYPEVVRHAVRSGGRLLLNLTNDAWYGRSSAPHQFLAITKLRSAETGLPMLRAANTGVSAVIDARGVVLQETPIFEKLALTVEVPRARATPTLYTRLGAWPLVLSWLVLVGCALRAWRVKA
ncbi:MAG: apolipoprotein N-acyltransferase [Myxococcota bacterium]